jgi:hypothetical protein
MAFLIQDPSVRLSFKQGMTTESFGIAESLSRDTTLRGGVSVFSALLAVSN